jgi:AcrR family transcriptional regulator
MADGISVVSVDGRRQRGERTRQAIIEAALSLQEEGVLVPTAQQISDRAGVLIRSFFRHFEDMETLFKAADDQLRDSYEALFIGGDRDGFLEERVNRAVERRSAAFEKLKNIFLGTKAQLWRYEMLRKNYARNQRGLRKDLEAWLPELTGLPEVECESIHAIASFEMWNRLRSEQGLSETASISVVKSTLISLLSSD